MMDLILESIHFFSDEKKNKAVIRDETKAFTLKILAKSLEERIIFLSNYKSNEIILTHFCCQYKKGDIKGVINVDKRSSERSLNLSLSPKQD